MRSLLFGLVVLTIAIQSECKPQFWDRIKNTAREAADFVSGAAKGSYDMARAYKDMRDANYIGSDKYFHARGNYDAAQHGAGGRWAAGVISDGREAVQGLFGSHAEDTAADQEANHWGRGGGDPNKYRPEGLPEEYRK